MSTQCDQCVCSSSGFFHARLTSRPIRLNKESSRHQQQLAVAMLLVLLFGLSPALVGRSLPRWPVGMQPGSSGRAAASLSLLQISSRAGRPLANANGRRQGGRRCCAAGSSRGSSQRLLFLHIRLPFSPSTALCPQLSHPWIPPHFPNTARSGRDSSFTLVE